MIRIRDAPLHRTEQTLHDYHQMTLWLPACLSPACLRPILGMCTYTIRQSGTYLFNRTHVYFVGDDVFRLNDIRFVNGRALQ